MTELKVAGIIEKDNDQQIDFNRGALSVIQMTAEYLHRTTVLAEGEAGIYILKNPAEVYERLTVREHIKFYRKWYGSHLKIDDLLKQYQLAGDAKLRISKCGPETIQRVGFVRAVLADASHVLAVEPLHHATDANIRLFHKLMSQLKEMDKSLVVVTSRTEDAFVISSNISKLNSDGLKNVPTEPEEPENNQNSLNRLKAKSQDKTIFVDLQDVEYIESDEGKVYINISREKFSIDYTLAEAEKKLKHYGFYRCHRSYIVNLDKVREIITWSKNTYSIAIENEEKSKIPLSRKKFSEIQELLTMG
ncbi:LytTR family transcriptional regulator DNA-binding domain-containing protein [Salinicoccus albus]|uniref:LytTR family transcriptional regulator DNA-binding domain-containing protein n=1 Tax=Salinicoccus albus TaxID=418756 RepID=UPI000369ABF1|nr:LytTR family transcriptional regulator DNA-binding domain-containing protein [Salinicoccus albus]